MVFPSLVGSYPSSHKTWLNSPDCSTLRQLASCRPWVGTSVLAHADGRQVAVEISSPLMHVFRPSFVAVYPVSHRTIFDDPDGSGSFQNSPLVPLAGGSGFGHDAGAWVFESSQCDPGAGCVPPR